MNEYLTVQEVATITGVSRQAVYQRIDKDLKEFVKLIKGKKMLHSKVLKMFVVNSTDNKVDSLDKQFTNELTSSLKEHIDLLTKQLNIKDTQIAELNDRLRDAQELTKNQQILLKSEQGKNQPLLAIDENKKSWFNWFKK